MATGAVYHASGLASNLDTQGIIDKLVQIESKPLTDLTAKQGAIAVQISSIGTLISNLNDFSSAARGLRSKGVTQITASGGSTDYSVSGSAFSAGRYKLKVEDLARAAKARSTGTAFTSGDSEVSATADTLKINVDGVNYNIAVPAHMKLKELAANINSSTGVKLDNGTDATSPFSATVVSDGTNSYLTIANKSAGHRLGQPASDAFTVVHDLPTLNLDTSVQVATNSVVYADNLKIERRTNELKDVVPGATITLKNASNSTSDLVFASDSSGAAGNLQKFVDTFNVVAKFLTDARTASLSGHNSDDKISGTLIMNLERRLQNLVSTPINATGGVRSLRDLGVALQKDGSLTLDSDKLNDAISADAAAVNAIFQKSTGIGTMADDIVQSQVSSSNGALYNRRKSLQTTTSQLTTKAHSIQDHLDRYRDQLQRQYSNLEQIMSGINATATFLDQQNLQLQKK
jgi:flagellar hook-associated protein 2